MAGPKKALPPQLAAHVFHKHTVLPGGGLGPAMPASYSAPLGPAAAPPMASSMAPMPPVSLPPMRRPASRGKKGK